MKTSDSFSKRLILGHYAHFFEAMTGIQGEVMNDSKHSLVEMNAHCMAGVRRFLQFEMSGSEILAFSAHVEGCFDCREYLESLSRLLARRETIMRWLGKEGPS